MTFFEDVATSVKNAAQSMSEKIHHAAAVNRVKMMIAKEERQMQSELTSLGTACFEQHKNPAAGTDFSDHFERIDKIQSRISALQMKLHELYMEKVEKETTREPASPPSEGILQFEQPTDTETTAGSVLVVKQPEPETENYGEERPESVEDNPEAEQLREDTISQLVDVVTEEAGSPDHDSDAGVLDEEIVSRNQEE